MLQASNAQVDRNDYDMVEYLGELRESVLEAYTGIIQGLKGSTGEVRNFSLNWWCKGHIAEQIINVCNTAGALGRSAGGAARAGHRDVYDASGVRARAHGRPHVGDRGAHGRPVHCVRAARAAAAGDAAAAGPAAGGAPLAHSAHQGAGQLGHQGDPQAQASDASH